MNLINLCLIYTSALIVVTIYSLFNYNPMYSLLFFILILINITLILFYYNYEFIPLLIGLIYFGAILILFFYIILLLNLQVVIRDNKHIKRAPLLIILLNILLFNGFKLWKDCGMASLLINNSSFITKLETFSFILFSDFNNIIIIIGLLLLIVLIGIVLMFITNKSIQLHKRKST